MRSNLLLSTLTAVALVGAPFFAMAQTSNESEPVPDNPDTEVNEFLESGGEVSEPSPTDNPDTAENEGTEPSPSEPEDNPDTAVDESQSGGDGGGDSGGGDSAI